jgi:hypothetical protein
MYIQQIIRRAVALFGIYPTMLTPKNAIIDLQRRIAPIQSQAELIRLGPTHDGGYLIPDDLEGISACYSPGVATTCGFELDCARFNIPVFMADYSIEAPPTPNPDFHFLKKYIGATTHGNYVSLDDWIAQTEPASGDLLLQMDIEGYEYETILACKMETLIRFRIIVIELHRFHLLFSDPIFRLYSGFFDKLLANHTCVHIHPNNYLDCESVYGVKIPKLLEMSFYRNDRISTRNLRREFKHNLDSDNIPSKPSVLLDKSWSQFLTNKS